MIVVYLFWICFGIIFYNYIGYTILLSVLVFFKNIFIRKKNTSEDFYPDVTLVIPAYNEKDYIDAKIENTNLLNYPKDKLKVIWITDGSNDGSIEKLKNIPGINVLHEDKRNGKIGAVNRAMKYVTTPFVVFCDANSMLNTECLTEILKPFKNPRIGCVGGEKKIIKQKIDIAVGTGEGSYWNYESLIKKLESKINSVVGAAGELFAMRSELYEEVPADSIIEDFVISLMIIRKKYKNSYNERAFSEETASLNITEELKRKVRIAYGSLQTFFRNLDLLNPFLYGFFSFQYFSHKVLRWMFVPYMIPSILALNIYIILKLNSSVIFDYLLGFQLLFYFIAFLGFLLKNKKIRVGIFFMPFYLLVMNFAIIEGYFKFLTSKQSVIWEKSKRS